MPACGTCRTTKALKPQMAARPGHPRLTNKLQCKKNRWRRSNPEGKFKERWFHEDFARKDQQELTLGRRRGGDCAGWGGGFVPSYEAGKKTEPQEKEAARAETDQSTTLNDQTELAVTVYNSNIALIRDVRQLQCPAADSG